MKNNLQLLQDNFNHCASKYLSNAKIQLNSANVIHKQLVDIISPNDLILDLGSGPGTLNYDDIPAVDNEIILFDLSINMLKNSFKSNLICGNANYLPFKNNSFDVVISNLMIQWVHDKTQVIQEIKRVLKPNGVLIITTLIAPCLYELQQAWQEVDNAQHTIIFDDKNQYDNLFKKHAQWYNFQSHEWSNTIYFPDIYTLMYHFKQTGTSMLKSTNNRGIGGKQQILNLAKAYEKQRTINGLPLTYHYMSIATRKE